jgi:hypothetical protein
LSQRYARRSPRLGMAFARLFLVTHSAGGISKCNAGSMWRAVGRPRELGRGPGKQRLGVDRANKDTLIVVKKLLGTFC